MYVMEADATTVVARGSIERWRTVEYRLEYCSIQLCVIALGIYNFGKPEAKIFHSVFSGERINFLFLLVAVLRFFVKLVCRLRLGCQKRFGTSIS